MGNKNILSLGTLFATIVFVYSCGDIKNPVQRNKLIFKDSLHAVEDSINIMNEILFKTGKGKYMFVVDSNYLYVNDSLNNISKIGLLSDTLTYKSELLFFIDKTERRRFVNLVLFLNQNYIGWCYLRYDQFVYMYRADIYMADRQKDLERFVIFATSKQEIDLTRYKILDSSGNLYLLADKNAKIWEN
jgi:hypothetical protein